MLSFPTSICEAVNRHASFTVIEMVTSAFSAPFL